MRTTAAFLALFLAPLAWGKWVTVWTGSVQGPYPVGNPLAQPNLSAVFPSPEAGAKDQSFRMIVRPDLWGAQTRLRFSNALGTKPVTFDGAFAGLQMSGAALMPGTNRPVHFNGKTSVTVAPGESAWSDPVALPFVKGAATELAGRKLAVSFHIAGESGPMTWHAKSLTSSYVTAPGAGAKGQDENESAFPFATTSWYFLDALDMTASDDTRVIVAFGDSITDGTASTLNGDDRWPDVLSRRLHSRWGNKIAIVNAGIGGNRVVGPTEYTPTNAFAGGPSSKMRLERDVLALSGVWAVIWMEGINDLEYPNNSGQTESPESIQAGYKDGVARMRAKFPGVKVIAGTLTSALGSKSNGGRGTLEGDAKRKAINEFLRHTDLFDGIADFDKATLDARTGELRPEFVPDSTIGGPGDKLHPNRLGYQAMGNAVDLELFAEKPHATH
ncbi:MAG: GDSL-type esterase/lipase family protein [Bryobacteraceae bacterium]